MRKPLLVGLIVVLGAFGVVVLLRSAEKAHAARNAGRRALFDEVKGLLEEYNRTEHHYPASLTDLVITNWPDGSSRGTLSRFHYQSDGTSFSLVCEPFGGGTVYVANGPKTKSTAVQNNLILDR